jgi:hypothetical protein
MRKDFFYILVRQKEGRMVCAVCGRDLQPLESVCPRCASANHVLKAEPGDYAITGYPVGTLVEGPPDSTEGRRVNSRPASGGDLFQHRFTWRVHGRSLRAAC